MSPDVLLRCRDVRVVLGGRPILSSVDVDLRRGEVTVLVGPNGAGKSTLFSVLAGDLLPAAGTVWTGTAEEERDAEVVELALAASETRALAEQQVPVLSGGERARVAFARALAQETGILLLDEPTAALDIRHQERVFAVVAERAAAGAAVLVILHDLSLAAAYADRILLLHDGRIRADGAPSDVLDAALLSEVYDHPVTVTVVPGTDDLLVVPRRGPAAAPSRPRAPQEGLA
ncbi:ATP-binding cassette domain-containing protein [Brachybacterium sp. DNPG3]